MEKLNIAEILKYCPKGMALYSPLCGVCEYAGVEKRYNYKYARIITKTEKGTEIWFNEYGKYFNDFTIDECLLFPSKENRDWSTFQRPFKDGDVVFFDDSIAIFKEWGDETLFRTYVKQYIRRESIDIGFPLFGKYIHKEARFATEEEKQKLFDTIKANGYKWNAETKTLEKLSKFKVGDKITDKNKFIYRITEITDKGYKLHDLKTTFITFEEADWYFVKVVDIFDINTLIPFESRVLVRSSYGDIWRPAIYGVFDSKKHYHYVVGGEYWTQCIPYESNEHLLGTTNDCDEYYKTWK